MDWITAIKEKLTKKERQTLIYASRIILARKNFYFYCKARKPKLYTDDTPYLKEICDAYQKCYEGKMINTKTGLPIKRIMTNIAPRHLKSLTVQLLEEWTMGNDISKSVITACHSTSLSITFSKFVRNAIQSKKINGNKTIIFSDIFPTVKIKKGDASAGKWGLQNNPVTNFLATSFESTITGFGVTGVAVLDDQINKDDQAKNDALLASQWKWFCDTLLSRLEKGSLLIVNMTRWSTNDICGMLERSGDIDNWLILKYEVKNLKTGEMLNYHVMDAQDYAFKKKMMSNEIFMANYHQKPVDSKGRLYGKFLTYESLPSDINMAIAEIKTQIDPSEGKERDYYCCITYIKHNGFAYVLDIFYENEKKKINPEIIGRFLIKNGSRKHRFEANKGEAAGEDIENYLIQNRYDYPKIDFYYSTGQNTGTKLARITSSVFWVEKLVIFPKDWDLKYPEAYMNLRLFYGNGTDATDDIEDVLSRIKEDLVNDKPKMGQPAAFVMKGTNIYGDYKFQN